MTSEERNRELGSLLLRKRKLDDQYARLQFDLDELNRKFTNPTWEDMSSDLSVLGMVPSTYSADEMRGGIK